MINFLIDGLLLGFIYGIAAMGLTLIWGVMKVINLAHGAVISLGMFGLYLLVSFLNLTPYLSLLVVAIAGLLLGFIVYYTAVKYVIDAPYLSSLLATFSINMIIIGLGTAIWGTSPYNVDFNLGSITLGSINIPITRLIAACISILTAGALYLFLFRTRLGKYIRAVTDNRAAAEIVGISSDHVLALSFGIGIMLAALSGALIATFFPFTILEGGKFQLKSFVIGVLGGLGNPIGALLGGLILGLLEGVIPAFLETSWVPVIEFFLFVFILLVRPRGILGTNK